jgi:hypothetical protein
MKYNLDIFNIHLFLIDSQMASENRKKKQDFVTHILLAYQTIDHS